MAQSLCMLAVMLLIVMLSSFVASLIPGRPIPEVVFFVFAGAIVGPTAWDWSDPTRAWHSWAAWDWACCS